MEFLLDDGGKPETQGVMFASPSEQGQGMLPHHLVQDRLLRISAPVLAGLARRHWRSRVARFVP
jgi:hypothetical protein